ncbi:MAG: hypothetical protein ACI9IP_002718 [Arcticibacterium sp.]|jgi:hypothetical protein
MKKILALLALLMFTVCEPTKANNPKGSSLESPQDSIRFAELDVYWEQVSKTVGEGNFEGYKALYHPDAVVVFAGGENKTSVSIESALARWEKGFNDTKAGRQNSSVEFRLSQRIGNDSTAHETGVFRYKSSDSNGKVVAKYFVHFEMLFVKKNNEWLSLMEYQKEPAAKEAWDALK